MPRNGKNFKVFHTIQPSLEVDLTDLLEDSKKCGAEDGTGLADRDDVIRRRSRRRLDERMMVRCNGWHLMLGLVTSEFKIFIPPQRFPSRVTMDQSLFPNL